MSQQRRQRFKGGRGSKIKKTKNKLVKKSKKRKHLSF
jgi:hypothetical protein